ncbi:hypothetical protein QQF64_022354 [Cirrhinus molitorella]|uniref:Complex 1 LYR protein domain-containing protein n=1 Tax=Cirrhinus molitorella TaxID=172907 RepID=A0ABR3L7Z2_9TELE
MAASSREHVLSLYRLLLKESKKFPSYNYRTYALRRVRDAFRENRTVEDPKVVEGLLNRARDSLALIQRQCLWRCLERVSGGDTLSSAAVIQRSVDSHTSQRPHTGQTHASLCYCTHNVPLCVVTPPACVPPSAHSHTPDWSTLTSSALL